MTSIPEPVRRNSFRRITEAEFLDVTLGKVQNVTRETRDGVDRIVTEFDAGTLILPVAAMRAWMGTLIGLGVLQIRSHQQSLASADCSGSYWPVGDLGDDPDGDNT